MPAQTEIIAGLGCKVACDRPVRSVLPSIAEARYKVPFTFATSVWNRPVVHLRQTSVYQPRAAGSSRAHAASPLINMEITRHNFVATLPAVQDALAVCDYFAFDCEMTGINLNDTKGTSIGGRGNGKAPMFLDDIEDRYEEMLSSSQAFSITQFGLSAFIWDVNTSSFRARSFTFYVFPRPFEEWDPRFTCAAGSLDFLANNNFDFNRWIRDGISYMPASIRDAKLAALSNELSGKARNDILITKDEDKAFDKTTAERIQTWVAAGDEGPPSLDLSSENSFQRALQYQTLRKLDQEIAGETSPGYYVEKIENSNGRPILRLVRATPAEIQAYTDKQTQSRREAINGAAAFVQILEAMRDCGKPGVGHNLSLDLAFSLQSFVTPLPTRWTQYKELVQKWFPAGIYDTKYISRQFPKSFQDTMLLKLYLTLKDAKRNTWVAEAVAGGMGWSPDRDAERAARTGGDDAILPIRERLPLVEHDIGFEKYGGGDADVFTHEAGYDAFLTGASFAGLAALLSSTDYDIDNAVSIQAPPTAGPLRPRLSTTSVLARKFLNKMNLTRSDMPYAALNGPDVVLERNNVLYVTSIPPGRFRDGRGIERQVVALMVDRGIAMPGDGLGRGLRATLLEGGCTALLEFADEQGLPDVSVLEEAMGPGSCIAGFAAYRDAKAALRLQRQGLVQDDNAMDASGARGKRRRADTDGINGKLAGTSERNPASMQATQNSGSAAQGRGCAIM